MKLKLTMTNAETGEVLQEETNLDFAMMCFGRKTEEGVDFEAVTRGESMTADEFAYCLDGVDSAAEKNLRDNKAVCMAYTMVKLGVLGKIVDVSAEARLGEGTADAKKEGEQG